MSFPKRTLHVIDVENLLGTGRFCLQDIEWLRGEYLLNVPMGEADLVIVAASSWEGAAAAGFGWPGARLVWQAGTDGADHALIDVLLGESVERRFTDVVIGSGDRAFAEPAARLTSGGCAVTVLSRPHGLSAHLRLAASTLCDGDWLVSHPLAPQDHAMSGDAA